MQRIVLIAMLVVAGFAGFVTGAILRSMETG